jgi:hypothetical protein
MTASRPSCRYARNTAFVTNGPDRTFEQGAANGSSEPILQFFCIAANNGFDD